MPDLAPDDYRALVEAMVETLAGTLARPAPVAAAAGLAAALESTLLAPEALPVQVDQLCDEAARLGVAAVCVNPCWVARAAARLRPTAVAVATVIGFPLGATVASAKLQEAADCLRLGADELDMVINLGALRAGWHDSVRAEIAAIAALAHAAGARLKVIAETALLSGEEKTRACGLALDAGADFIKTSTGFAASGATVEDVALFRAVIAARPGSAMAIKAAGGIRTRQQAEALLAAGATRLGTSHAAALLGG